jgi:glutathione S-transferase
MPYVHLVVLLAVAQFFYFAIMVGKARGQYNVPAPATTGNEVFERYFRVQMNTLELLVIFIPSALIFGQYLWPYGAAGLGVVYLAGRQIYFGSYVKDPKSRSVGYALSALPILILLGGAIFGSVRAAFLWSR